MLEVEFDGFAPALNRNVLCDAVPQRRVRAEVFTPTPVDLLGFGTLSAPARNHFGVIEFTS